MSARTTDAGETLKNRSSRMVVAFCSSRSNVNIEIVRVDSARDFNVDSEYRLLMPMGAELSCA